MLGIHDLMVHDYGPGSKLVSFHIELSADSDVMKSHDLIDLSSGIFRCMTICWSRSTLTLL